MSKDFRLVSLDTETGGLDPSIHSLLSIALVDVGNGDCLYREIIPDELNITPEAMAVNKLDLNNWEEIQDLRLPTYKVLEQVKDFFLGPSQTLVIGMNVAFDVEFAKRQLGFNGLGYRHLDLNSLLIAGAYQANMSFNVARRQYLGRATVKLQEWLVGKEFSVSMQAHNALYDAYFNCFLLSGIIEKKEEWM